MISSIEVVARIQRERQQDAAESRLARIARLARRYNGVSEPKVEQIARSLPRPAAQCC